MKKKVNILLRQSSSWDVISKHTFCNRNYEVDDEGNFYSNGIKKIVKPDKSLSFSYGLTDDNNVQVRFKLHQIILQTFCEGKLKDGLSVDHKDRNRLNNNLSNLRFATRKEQYDNRENKEYKYKPVICINNQIKYESCQNAEDKLGLVKNTVSRVARGERKSIHGYKFKYI